MRSYSGIFWLPLSKYATFYKKNLVLNQRQIYSIEDRDGHIPLFLTIKYRSVYINLFYTRT